MREPLGEEGTKLQQRTVLVAVLSRGLLQQLTKKMKMWKCDSPASTGYLKKKKAIKLSEITVFTMSDWY